MTQLTFGEVCGEAARTSAPPHCPAAWSRAGKMLRVSRTTSPTATPSSGPPGKLALFKMALAPPLAPTTCPRAIKASCLRDSRSPGSRQRSRAIKPGGEPRDPMRTAICNNVAAGLTTLKRKALDAARSHARLAGRCHLPVRHTHRGIIAKTAAQEGDGLQRSVSCLLDLQEPLFK